MVLALRLGLLIALLLTALPPAWAQAAPPRLQFVAASTNRAKGPAAVDGDRSTTWLALARRDPAWITFRLAAVTPLLGIVVTTAPMPASTYYHVDVSKDGETFEPVLKDLQNGTDKPTVRAFGGQRDVKALRLRFENGSRQPMIPFALHEVSALPQGSLPEAAAIATDALPVVLAQTPSPAPGPRILGAVLGRYEGDRVLVVVGDGFAGTVEAVLVNDRPIEVLESTPTQVLCRYPFGKEAKVTVVLKTGGRTVTRRVPMVQRDVRWQPEDRD